MEYASRAYVDGTYKIQVKHKWGFTWSCIPEDREFLDYLVKVTLQLGGGDGVAGLLFRYRDRDNFYCFTIRTDRRYRLRMRRNGEWHTLVGWTETPGFDPSTPHRLGLTAQGSDFSSFLNKGLNRVSFPGGVPISKGLEVDD